MALLSRRPQAVLDLWRRAAAHPARRGAGAARAGRHGGAGRPRPAACSPTATSSGSSWRSRWPTSRKLLLMDEPTAGMAPQERNDADGADASSWCVERGMAVLFTEHSMDVVFAYADRMIVLARGRLIAQGKPARDPRPSARCRRSTSARGTTFEKQRSESRAVHAASTRTRPRESLLEVERLDAWYGAAQILFDVDLRSAARRGRRADGPQRRRQVDHDEGAHGPARQAHAARVASWATTSRRREPHRRSRGWAWASCPRTGASSPT